MEVINHDLSSELEKIKLLPLADLHLGDKLIDNRRLKQWQKQVKENDNIFIIVNGDLINNAVRHGVSDIYNEEFPPGVAIDKLVEILEPIKEKILVMHGGNHENRTYRSDGISIIRRTSKELGISDRYADIAYLLYIAFGKNQGRDSRKTVYAVYGKHGTGGARTKGGKTNYVDRLSNIVTDADIYLHSHTHLPLSFRDTCYITDYRNRKTTQKERLYVNTNAFLQYGGYGEQKNYSPNSTMYPEIILDGYKRKARAII